MKSRVALCVCLLVLCIFTIASAESIQPYADTEFAYASAALTTKKLVSFSCTTYDDKNTIQITSCWLQKRLMINGNGLLL